MFTRPEEDVSREKALQTVVAGQQAENLLDFDDEPMSASSSTNRDEDGLGGLSSLSAGGNVGGISSQAIASAAKSTNPLDELMDLFNSSSMSAPIAQPQQQQQSTGVPASGSGGMSVLNDLQSPTTLSPLPTGQQAKPVQQQQQSGNDDLLGLF